MHWRRAFSRSLPPFKFHRLWSSLAYALLGLLALLSLIPAPDLGSSDKLLHFFAYAGLSAIFVILVQRQRALWLVVVGLLLFGVLIEFAQGFTSYRMLDSRDMLANGLGVFSGLILRATAIPETIRLIEARWL